MKQLVYLFVLLFIGITAQASNQDALDFYLKGQKLYSAGKYEEARQWLQKAVNEYPYDGQITISKGKAKYRWEETPRGPKRIKVSDGTESRSYYPNDLLRKTDAELAKQRAAALKQQERRKKFSNPPNLLISYNLTGDGVLDAGETARLLVTVENNGGYEARNVKLKISDYKDIKFSGNFNFNNIAAQDGKTQSYNVTASRSLPDGQVTFSLTAVEADGFDSFPVSAALSTQAYKAPRLEIANERVVHLGNRKLEAIYTISNTGRGAASNVVAKLEVPNTIFLNDEADRNKKLGDLSIGQTKEVRFQFFANRIKANQPLPIKLRILENDPANNASHKFAVNMPDLAAGIHSSGAIPAPPPLPVPAASGERPNLVLFPIEVSAVDADFAEDFGSALQEGLTTRYTVFYGPQVEAELEKEYQKIDCDADSCAQNVAIAFNGELIADASAKRLGNGYSLKLVIRNVITGQIVETKTNPCRNCDGFAVIEAFKLLGRGY